MKSFVLNCDEMTTRVAAHAHMKAVFDFPDYYGENLDALYDCLTDIRPEQIILKNSPALSALGDYASMLIATLCDACGQVTQE